jgi:hypothetical protein
VSGVIVVGPHPQAALLLAGHHEGLLHWEFQERPTNPDERTEEDCWATKDVSQAV